MEKKETAGALAVKAASDSTRYDLIEAAHAANEGLAEQMQLCINTHNQIFDEEWYCICFVYAKDPLIPYGLKRRKFYGYPYLPSPRPEQTVFLYNKSKDRLEKRLWSLPDWKRMALLSELSSVDEEWKDMKRWSDAFYAGRFWETIRKDHNITMQSEIEFLNANREKLIQAGCKQVDSTFADSFDFSKVTVNKIVDTGNALTA